MKKFSFLFAFLFIAVSGMAQPPTIKVTNDTDCMMYVHLIEANAACSTATHDVAVPPNSVIGVNSTLPGGHFEFALVTDTFGPYDYSCYYVKVQVPWATCFSGYPSEDGASTCCAASPLVKSSWVMPPSSPSLPYLFIYD